MTDAKPCDFCGGAWVARGLCPICGSPEIVAAREDRSMPTPYQGSLMTTELELASCERCNGRGVIETGELSNGPGGYGYVTVPCGCEERQAYRDAASEAGWLIELEVFDRDEGPLPTAWAPKEGYELGPEIRREQLPAGAVYEHGRAPGRLWLNDEPHLMTLDDSSFATWFKVATLRARSIQGKE